MTFESPSSDMRGDNMTLPAFNKYRNASGVLSSWKEFQKIIFHILIHPILPQTFPVFIAATKSAVTTYFPLEVLNTQKTS
jgi:hypothetical protein